MKADYWRKGLATVMTAALLATGAVAQDGAEGEVNIQDAAPAETSAPAETKPAARPIKPQIVDRDPFVNQLLTGNISTSTAGSRPATRNIRRPDAAPASSITPAGSTASAAPIGAGEEEVEEVEIPAPEVTVNGIVSSGSGRQAIISTGVGTRMISPGMKLGDYRVSAIGPDSVTFSYGGKKDFKVPIESEFGK